MEWVKKFIAQETINGTFVEFFDHIVEVRKHKPVADGVIYDLFSKGITSRLERITSILVPTEFANPKLYGERETMAYFRNLAKDSKITEDMLDATL